MTRDTAIDDAQKQTPPLDYAPAPKRRWRVWWRWVVIILLAVAAGVAYRKRAEISEKWLRGRLLYAQRQCLTFRDRAERVRYDDDPQAAAALVAADGKTYSLINGAACARSPGWDTFFTRAGRNITYVWASVPPGASVFLHELRSAGGQRMLVHIVFTPDAVNRRAPAGGGSTNGRGALIVTAIEPGTWSADPNWRSGLRSDSAFAMRVNERREVLEFNPLDPGQRLRLFAGHVDPTDASRAIIPYEVDGRRRRWGVRMVDSPGWTFPVQFEMNPLDALVTTRRAR